jgi:acetyl-CoA carboxylase biotin carboxyl carrier protein
MDIKQVQELIKLVSKSSLSELTIEEGDFKITLKQKEDMPAQTYVAAPVMAAQMAQAPIASAPAVAPVATPPPAAAAEDTSKYITIKSPMIGTFYRRPAPDKPLYVEVGDDIAPGKVVCIIEAMKLFNEIESEVKGRIVKILVDDQTPVEYDQPLYLVDPS